MIINLFPPKPDPFDRKAGTDFGYDCNDCGLVFYEEIGYHGPSPEAWNGYLYWCRSCAAEMGVEVSS